jgi:hypothetical protein
MFELSQLLRSQIATLRHGEHKKYLPYEFTEHGVLMLSNVIKSKNAISVSIQIIDVFVKLRQALTDNTELRLVIEELRKKTDNNTKIIEVVFLPIAIWNFDELLDKKDTSTSSVSEVKPRTQIGFKIGKK